MQYRYGFIQYTTDRLQITLMEDTDTFRNSACWLPRRGLAAYEDQESPLVSFQSVTSPDIYLSHVDTNDVKEKAYECTETFE